MDYETHKGIRALEEGLDEEEETTDETEKKGDDTDDEKKENGLCTDGDEKWTE